jgi:hypothetical protein
VLSTVKNIDHAGVQLQLRNLVGAPCLRNGFLLALPLQRGLLQGDERILNIAERRHYRFMVVSQQLRVACLAVRILSRQRNRLRRGAA